MALSFTNAGDYRRGRGIRNSRFGPRHGVPLYGTRRQKTPNDLAAKKLYNSLGNRYTENQRREMIRPLRKTEQLRFMSMPVLADVIDYIYNTGLDQVDEHFSYESISPYIDTLVRRHVDTKRGRTPTADDIAIMRIRMAATFLRYTQYVVGAYQASGQAQAQIQASSRRPGAFDESE